MTSYVFSRQFSDIQVVARDRGEGFRDIRLCGTAIVLLLVLLMAYVYFPNRIVEVDYKIEEAKTGVARLMQERELLKMRESQLCSMARLEMQAARLGLAAPRAAQVEYVDDGAGMPRPEIVASDSRIVREAANQP